MKIGISADSACDLTQEQVQKFNINIMPMIITLGEEEFEDGKDINQQMLFDFANKTGKLPKTAARNEYEYQEHFENMLKDYDYIFHFAISSKISSTINNAIKASKNIDENKIKVIDTLSISSGIGMQVLSCVDKIQKGESPDQILTELLDEVKNVQASFLVDTLKYLHMGGRCSGMSAVIASVLPIKPKISLIEGEMKSTKKYMGKIESSLIRYIDDLFETCPPNLKRVFVTYSTPTANIEQIKEKLKNYGFQEIIESVAGPTVSTHCGPKTLGVMYSKL